MLYPTSNSAQRPSCRGNYETGKQRIKESNHNSCRHKYTCSMLYLILHNIELFLKSSTFSPIGIQAVFTLYVTGLYFIYEKSFLLKNEGESSRSFILAECPFISMEQNMPSAISFNNDLCSLSSRRLSTWLVVLDKWDCFSASVIDSDVQVWTLFLCCATLIRLFNWKCVMFTEHQKEHKMFVKVCWSNFQPQDGNGVYIFYQHLDYVLLYNLQFGLC